MDEQGYNGWTNYETWAVALWIDNEEPLYRERLERVAEAIEEAQGHENVGSGIWTQEQATAFVVSDMLKGWIRDELAPDLGASLWADLLGAALDSVDWREIAEHWIDEYEPETDSSGEQTGDEA